MSWHLTHIDFRSELGARRGAGGSPTSRLWAESLPLPQIAAASPSRLHLFQALVLFPDGGEMLGKGWPEILDVGKGLFS